MAKQPRDGRSQNAGRPIEPDSLRQSGTNLYVRCSQEDKTRWSKRAKREGRALADIVREMLNEWEQGKRS